jgi:hypothetical protein
MKKFLATIWDHAKSWPEAYVLLPLVLLALVAVPSYVYLLTESAPKVNMDWLVDLNGRALVAILAVFFTSFTRQVTGVWCSKQESLDHPYFATLQSASNLFCLGLFVYLFTH